VEPTIKMEIFTLKRIMAMISELLHEDDYIRCEKCGYTGYGKEVAEALKKKFNMILCPCCKGKGFVPKDK
jgi:predicted methyltransferase